MPAPHEPVILPLFPLGTTLFPGLVMPLNIFEDRYVQLVRELQPLPAEECAFGVVPIAYGVEVAVDQANAVPRTFDYGCLAELREIEDRTDGGFDLVTVGTRRFRVLSLDDSAPVLRGEVEWVDEAPGEQAHALSMAVTAAFSDYRRILTGHTTPLDIPDDPRLMSYLVAAALVQPPGRKHELLAAADDSQRLALELGWLQEEVAIMSRFPSLPAVEMTREPIAPN